MKSITRLIVAFLIIGALFSCEKNNEIVNSITFFMDGVELIETDTMSLNLNTYNIMVLETSCDKSTGLKVYKQIDYGEPFDISNSEETKTLSTTYGSVYKQSQEVYIHLTDSCYARGQELKYSVQMNTIEFGDYRKSIVFRVK